MLLKICKLLRMTYNDISEFFGLVPGTWWPFEMSGERKGSHTPQNILQSLKENLTNWI